MATRVQIVFDCADPGRLVAFWATALDYVVPDPPHGHATWREYYIASGEPEEELGDGDAADRLIDPEGIGPRFWFQVVPEGKAVKNRVHLDLAVSGGMGVALEVRRERVDAQAQRLVAAGATQVRVLHSPDTGHYGVVMQDPEGNEFCLH